jgi:hypothetical protein
MPPFACDIACDDGGRGASSMNWWTDGRTDGWLDGGMEGLVVWGSPIGDGISGVRAGVRAERVRSTASR